MVVLGIDPGIGRMGYGVLAHSEGKGNRLEVEGYGCIETEKGLADNVRLLEIYQELSKIIEEYRPEGVALEKLFFNTNVTTAMQVGRASGVVLLLAAQKGLPVYEYTPLQIKSAVAGYGRAEKGQVQRMVQKLLDLPEIPQPDDAADGLAVALCHFVTGRIEN